MVGKLVIVDRDHGPLMTGLDADFVAGRGDFTLDIELGIEPGTTAALLGPNGAGKSTTVAAISGLLPIEKGRMAFDGVVWDDPDHDVFVTPEERRVGVVFQDYALFPHLTVLENVAFGPRSRGMPRGVSHTEAGGWLDRVGLGHLAGSQPKDLSGGQRQLVALARAVAAEPSLLLLDEPLAALDVTTRVELRRSLRRHLEDFPGPRLLITHDPTEAFLLADEVHILENGVITQRGSADEIRLRPRTRYAADLVGSNLVRGEADRGVVTTPEHILHIADTGVRGPILATIHPRSVSLHTTEPMGSPRNVWRTTVELLENLGDRVRVNVGPPMALTVEVTPAAVTALELSPGVEVWLSLKATEIGVEPA